MFKFMDMILHFEIKELRGFNKFSEEHLKMYQNDIDERIEKATFGMSEDDKNKYTAEHDYIWWRSAVSYPNMMRKSIFLSNYSFMEHTINELSNHAQEILRLELSLEDVRGRGIVRAKNYLTKHCNITFPKNHDNWRKFKLYQKLRNSITHEYGSAADFENVRDSDLIEIAGITQVEGIYGGGWTYSEEFNHTFLNLIEELTKELVDELKSY